MNPSPVLVFIQSAAAVTSLAAVLLALWVALKSDRLRTAEREREARAHARRVRAELVTAGGVFQLGSDGEMTRGVIVRVENASPQSILVPRASFAPRAETNPPTVDIVNQLPMVMLPGESRDLSVMPIQRINNRDPSILHTASLASHQLVMEWVDDDGRSWEATYGRIPVLQLVSEDAFQRMHS